MPNKTCLENISKKPPPYNIPCSNSHCNKIVHAIDQHCFQSNLPPCAPVLTWDPSINEPCYCCCNCQSHSTPIAISNDEFALVHSLVEGDSVLVTGPDLKWRMARISSISKPIDVSMTSGLYLVQYVMQHNDQKMHLIVPQGHLFLKAEDKSLVEVENLCIGDGLLSADGNMARVDFVTTGVFEMQIQNIELEGDFDGKNLDGHLINTNGIISADFKVQAFYEAN